MADSDRIVFPDEVEDAKAAAADAKKEVGGETNTIEEAPAVPTVTVRNMVQVPSNCPEGYKMGADGVCREVFD